MIKGKNYNHRNHHLQVESEVNPQSHRVDAIRRGAPGGRSSRSAGSLKGETGKLRSTTFPYCLLVCRMHHWRQRIWSLQLLFRGNPNYGWQDREKNKLPPRVFSLAQLVICRYFRHFGQQEIVCDSWSPVAGSIFRFIQTCWINTSRGMPCRGWMLEWAGLTTFNSWVGRDLEAGYIILRDWHWVVWILGLGTCIYGPGFPIGVECWTRGAGRITWGGWLCLAGLIGLTLSARAGSENGTEW
jgi:hypothetical protein